MTNITLLSTPTTDVVHPETLEFWTDVGSFLRASGVGIHSMLVVMQAEDGEVFESSIMHPDADPYKLAGYLHKCQLDLLLDDSDE